LSFFYSQPLLQLLQLFQPLYHLVDRAFAVVMEKDTVSGRVIPEVQAYEEF